MSAPRPFPLVLIVDDDDDIRDVLLDVIGRCGYPVAGASDGAEALRFLRARTDEPCVVVLDLMMPNVDGHEVLATIRAEALPAEVVVLSASGHADTVPAGTRFIAKPVPRARLLAELDLIQSAMREPE